MPPFPFLHPLVLDLILSRITPWLLQTAENDINAAQGAAIALLRAFDPVTEQEALLAAEAICFHLGSLESLSKSVSPGLSIATVLRMRGNANTLNRSAHRSQAKLAALRKQRAVRPVEAAAVSPNPAQAQQPKRPVHPPAKPSAQQDRERWEAGRSRRPVTAGSRPAPLAAVMPARVQRRKAA